MKREELIKQALSEIAEEGSLGHSNPWPIIENKAKSLPSHPKFQLSRRSIFLLAAVALITIAAGVYLVLMDSGLRKADEAGLVSHLHQSAAPTVFSVLPAQLSTVNHVSQTQNGITVTLDWAYADELRVAWQLTITGLSIPRGANPGDFICTPHATTEQGISLNPTIGDIKMLEDQPGNPFVISYLSYQRIDAARYDHLNLTVDLTVGPCAQEWNYDYQESYWGPGPTVTPVPLIGTYQLKFQLPVNKGKTITPNQTVAVSGIKIRLESITTTPSYTTVRLCYAAPPIRDLAGKVNSYWLWSPQGVTIRAGDGAPIQVDNGNLLNLGSYERPDSSEHCGELGFNAPINLDSGKIVVRISSFEEDEPGNIFSDPIAQANAMNQLAQQGIVIKFIPNGVYSWTIVTKPAEMTDDQANGAVMDLLKHQFIGPWKFVINP